MTQDISKDGDPNISRPLPAQNGSKQFLPRSDQYTARGTLPNTPLAISMISVVLGGACSVAIVLAALPILEGLGARKWEWPRSRLGLYIFSLGLFHLCEFWTTAGWNPQKLSVDAFLLNNGRTYHMAHAFGLSEYFISSYFFPRKFNSFMSSWPWLIGSTILLLAGQSLRSLAMIHANTSFSHVVKKVKHDDHTLITHGVYSWSRHPSYVGFFYWAIATQLLLGNIIAPIGFALILGKFFYSRIIDEEKHLVKFFGNDYVEYRTSVGTGLPFPIPTTKFHTD